MDPEHKIDKQFYGTATVGEKGQIVIPAEARQAMSVERGEKLLAFGIGENILAFVRLSEVEQMATHLSSRLESIRKIIAETEE
ncbi:MAG: AbrB/MazE/SpoVT family DNA-binding domain-containing protein [Thermoleophilia bacterium]